MKRSKLHEVIGALVTAGRTDLAKVLSRSPLCNVPKPTRLETEEQKQAKRDKSNKSYHDTSPAEKRKKAKKRKQRELKELNDTQG